MHSLTKFKRMFKKERHEHPSFTAGQITRIVKDHMRIKKR